MTILRKQNWTKEYSNKVTKRNFFLNFIYFPHFCFIPYPIFVVVFLKLNQLFKEIKIISVSDFLNSVLKMFKIKTQLVSIWRIWVLQFREGKGWITAGGEKRRGNNKHHKTNFFKNGAWSMDYVVWLSALVLAREWSQWPTKSLYDLMFYSIYHFKFLQGSIQFQDDSCNWTLRW